MFKRYRKARFLARITALSGLLITALPTAQAQLAAGKPKFLGNVSKTTSNPADFTSLWNQVTPENSGKWGSAEPTRDAINFTNTNVAYNLAKNNGFKYKHHVLIWGQQEPTWMAALSAADQRAEIEEWMDAVAAAFPNLDQIEVVNEPLNAPSSFRAAMGGNGTTGWDWVIWAFEKARAKFPGKQLLLNDYNILKSDAATTNYLTIINLLKDRGLIDGIGEQGHFLENTSATTIRNNLNRLAATGLPVYITEYDVNIANDANQQAKYQEQFPIFWENPQVRGVTLWGYRQGAIWRSDAYLKRTDETERPALTWLRSYVQNNTEIRVRAKGKLGSESIQVKVNGTTKGTFTLTTAMKEYVVYGTAGATIRVEFTNDATGRDVQVDYVKINNTTRQAEAQPINTGNYGNGGCRTAPGEWLYCNGYIEFTNGGVRLNAESIADNMVAEPGTLLEVYPNPAPGTFTVELPNHTRELSIFDQQGRLQRTYPAEGRSRLTVSPALPSGSYLLNVPGQTKRVIIE
jgi:endo-1,4-beta-xylanase